LRIDPGTGSLGGRRPHPIPALEQDLNDESRPALTEASSNAEILLWQARYRALFMSLVGFSTITLKWFGVISSNSLYADRFGVRPLLLAALGVIAVYLVGHRLLAGYLRHAGRAGNGIVIGAIASDMLAIFIAVMLITPPEHFDRVLIVSIFTVQFTQIFFGWTATVANLAFIAIGYTSLVALAADQGARISPAEELWTLALYGIGVLVYVGLQGHVATRMRGLVQIFNKAQEGDFGARYDESADQMPDPVTVIGRAYNRMRAHLEAIVLTDPLSGCFNRRGLNQLAEREVSRAVRRKLQIAVLAIDVDHFKAINDEFGHLTGDEVIREVGALLRETAREVDVVARVGGEEFCVLLPNTPAIGARLPAERVRSAIANMNGPIPITVSIGVSSFPEDAHMSRELFERADQALYEAKRRGRNRVHTSNAA
jgi:diguanylate cyclase (GGDEF)-like protein